MCYIYRAWLVLQVHDGHRVMGHVEERIQGNPRELHDEVAQAQRRHDVHPWGR